MTFKRILHRIGGYYYAKHRKPQGTTKRTETTVVCAQVIDQIFGNGTGHARIRVTVDTSRQRGKGWHHVKRHSIYDRYCRIGGESHYMLTYVRETFSRLGVTSLWFKVEAL